jgi:phosphatidate cytidylyltransferase
VIAALILIPLAVTVVWVGSLPLLAVVISAGLVMAYEGNRVAGGSPASTAAVFAYLTIGATLGVGWQWGPAMALIPLGLGVLAAGTTARRSGLWIYWPIAGLPYVTLALAAFLWVRGQPGIGRELALWLLAVVWATDIFAFFVGRRLGRARLAPRISPNKTWMGLGGGILGASLTGGVLAASFEISNWLTAAAAAGVLAVVAQAGDLLESAFKRRFGVKDSSNLIPGHGGVLDRLDGVAAAALALAALLLVGDRFVLALPFARVS